MTARKAHDIINSQMKMVHPVDVLTPQEVAASSNILTYKEYHMEVDSFLNM
jgi:hypothetical protein